FCHAIDSAAFYNTVFSGYNNAVRPVVNASTTVVIQTQLHNLTILNYDPHGSMMTLSVNLELAWTDELLKWTPSEANGFASAIVVPITSIWRPQIVFYTGSTENMTETSLVRVNSDGSIEYSYIRLLTNHCPMDMHRFPFDTQTCHINITTWSYTNSEVFMQPVESIDEANGTGSTNGELVVSAVYGFTDPHNWDLKYVLHLHRRPTYYISVVMIPTFIAATMCLLGLFIPRVNTGTRFTKMYLSLSVLFFMYQILGTVSNDLTKTGYLPNLARFIFTELIVCSVATVVSVVILVAHLYYTVNSANHAPYWLRAATCIKRSKVQSASETNKSSVEESWATSLVQDCDRCTEALYKEVAEKSSAHITSCVRDLDRIRKWTIAFDQIDLLFVLLFQVINIIIFIVFVV
ncbi:hypothetical protein PENTCL1PPCAC_9372, partial [Pristionchus entomophagus]